MKLSKMTVAWRRYRIYADEPSKPPRFSTLRMTWQETQDQFVCRLSCFFNRLLIPLRFRPLFRAYLDRSIFAPHNTP